MTKQREPIATGELQGDYSWVLFNTRTVVLCRGNDHILYVPDVSEELEARGLLARFMEGAAELHSSPAIAANAAPRPRPVFAVNFRADKRDREKNQVSTNILEAIYREGSPFTAAEQLLMLMGAYSMNVYFTPETIKPLEASLPRLKDFPENSIPWDKTMNLWLLPEIKHLAQGDAGKSLPSKKPSPFYDFNEYLTYLRLGDFLASNTEETFPVWLSTHSKVEQTPIPLPLLAGMRNLLLESVQRRFLDLNCLQFSQLLLAIDDDTVALANFITARIQEGKLPAVCGVDESRQRGLSAHLLRNSVNEVGRVLTQDEKDKLYVHLEAHPMDTLADTFRASSRACLGVLVLVAQFGVTYTEELLNILPPRHYHRAVQKNLHLKELASLSEFHEEYMSPHLLLAFSNLDTQFEKAFG